MDFLSDELHKIGNLIIIAGVAFAAGYVLYVFFVKKSFVAMIAALLTAAIFVWGINNIGWFRSQVKKETGKDAKADFGSVPKAPIMNPPGMVIILPRDGKR
jgi:peroxiredoxin family protein